MSVNSHVAGNVGITSSGVIAAGTAANGVVGWLNENGMVIGIALSVISLIIGVVFKLLEIKRNEQQHKERLIQDAKQSVIALNALRDEIRLELRNDIKTSD